MSPTSYAAESLPSATSFNREAFPGITWEDATFTWQSAWDKTWGELASVTYTAESLPSATSFSAETLP